LEDTYSSCSICGIFRAVGMNQKCTEKDCANGNGLICEPCGKKLHEINHFFVQELKQKEEEKEEEK
jgi:hypothetical protein